MFFAACGALPRLPSLSQTNKIRGHPFSPQKNTRTILNFLFLSLKNVYGMRDWAAIERYREDEEDEEEEEGEEEEEWVG